MKIMYRNILKHRCKTAEPISKNTNSNTEKWKLTHTNSNYWHQLITNLDQGLGLSLVLTTRTSLLGIKVSVSVSSWTDRQTSRTCLGLRIQGLGHLGLVHIPACYYTQIIYRGLSKKLQDH